jgi:signal transduction histidine kinase
LLHKYRSDIFFHTEVNVLALQALFALTIIALVVISFSILYHNISFAIVDGIRAGITSNQPAAMGAAIVSEVENIRSLNIMIIVGVVILATILFGYIIGRVTLRPARNALESQKQFIGNVAHELRTPLSIIKTNTEVALLDGAITGDMKSTLLSNVEELDRVSQIINNLLSLSILVHPEDMEFASVDFSSLIAGVVEQYAAFAKSKSLEVAVRTGPNMYVWGNATALEQIVGNILKNAIAYTQKSGRIRVTIDRTLYGHIEFAVQDSGIGIPRKDLYRIFEPFYRAERSRARSSAGIRTNAGTGLGLTIVSELVKAHEGRIAIRSSVGRGTTVTVLLPAARTNDMSDIRPAHASAPSEVAIDFSKSVA